MPCLPIFGWFPGAANASADWIVTAALFSRRTLLGDRHSHFPQLTVLAIRFRGPHEEVMVRHGSFFKRAFASHRIIAGFKNAAIAFHPEKPIERPVGRRCYYSANEASMSSANPCCVSD